ncbi:hypothetical protein [Leifsonia naganoensis]|uniref:Uncharacterized protein n=1 Tax=Leifsonia naganoensis TaxID=150025 RepID=A0A853DPJ3_9MICO|nr:hypothetical protein [Leifsonia naganoensis]NYK09429.1 hypothetical protein [Leifsonia naganoensis]
MDSAPERYCPSRNGGRHCTRPLGHPGLHRRGALLWSDASADAPRCPGSGEPGTPARELADGYPGGRALCDRCLRFIALDGTGRLVEHDTTDAAETDAEIASRREWFNTIGW